MGRIGRLTGAIATCRSVGEVSGEQYGCRDEEGRHLLPQDVESGV
jgi:hypothetical protein